MKPQTIYDQGIRCEAGSLFEAPDGTKCVVIACTSVPVIGTTNTVRLTACRHMSGYISHFKWSNVMTSR